MGAFEKKFWDSDSWYGKSGAYSAYVPDMLAGAQMALDQGVSKAVAEATALMRELDCSAEVLTDTEPIARLLMRSEALASSRIEGMTVPAKKILEIEALDELGVTHRLDSTEVMALANIAAMRAAVEAVGRGDEITLESLCEVNRMLTEGSQAADQGGKLREVQNWVGGSDYSPVGAAYVPPSPELVGGLLRDLVDFCNTSGLPALAKAAVAHAQFESIHPFVDGNGRTGRALIQMVLRREGAAEHTVPPISLALATDRPAYIEHLMAFRADGVASYETGACQDLISFFAEKTVEACNIAMVFERRIRALQQGWRERVSPRSGSAAERLLSVLPGNPVVSVASAARLCSRSNEAVRNAIPALVDTGVLHQTSKNRKSNIYCADEVLAEFTALERALGTPGGNTAVARPARAVPQRAI